MKQIPAFPETTIILSTDGTLKIHQPDGSLAGSSIFIPAPMIPFFISSLQEVVREGIPQ